MTIFDEGWCSRPNKVLHLTGHVKYGFARHGDFSRVSRQVSLVVRRRRLNVTRSRWRIAGLVLAGLLVVVGLWFFWPRPQVTIEVSGLPGMKLVGTIKAGQAEGPIGGSLPTTITAKARSVSYTLENVGEEGDLTIRVFIDGKLSDTLTADRDHPVVRGTVESGRVSQKAEPKQGQ